MISRRMSCLSLLVYMGEKRGGRGVRSPFGRHSSRWEDTIKIRYELKWGGRHEVGLCPSRLGTVLMNP
jgi:hypothetical protein